MSELKPCPFCGNEAYLSNLSRGFFVTCVTGDCHANTDAANPYVKAVDAIEAWNTRAERTCRDIGHEKGYRRIFVCSECDSENYDGTPSYCPSCGAKVVE